MIIFYVVLAVSPMKMIGLFQRMVWDDAFPK